LDSDLEHPQAVAMKLYFNPLACSLASRIAIYEAGLAVDLIEVDTRTKRTFDGKDFRAVHPLGLVPALVLDDGQLLTENGAVLQYLADRAPDKHLAPPGGLARSYLQQWLCFIGTELHKTLAPLLDKATPPEVRAYMLAKVPSRLDHVANHLANRTYLLDELSVADGYLFAVLNWTNVIPQIELATWPALTSFMARMLDRPSVARAFHDERDLYLAELKRTA
jgi:glutathione S-transferase